MPLLHRLALGTLILFMCPLVSVVVTPRTLVQVIGVNKETQISPHTGEMLPTEALGFMEDIFELLLTRHGSWIFAFSSRC